MKNPLQSAASLFDLADAGVFTLPAPLTAARTACVRVRALEVEPAPAVSTAVEARAHALVAGEDLDPAAVLEAQRGRDERDAAHLILNRARDIALDELREALLSEVDRVVSDHMAPVVTEIAAEMKAVFPKVTGTADLNTEGLLRLPKATQTAVLRFGELVDRFGLIGNARTRLYLTVGRQPTNDTRGMFAAVRNFEKVAPSILGPASTMHGYEVPRDVSAAALLTWQLERGAVLWCPTVAQQEARWWEVFGARVEEQKRNRHNMEGFRALHAAS